MSSNYVYMHRDADGRVFYVGEGNKKRPFNSKARSLAWKERAANGYTTQIVDVVDSKEVAQEIEELLIDLIGLEHLVNVGKNASDVSKRRQGDKQWGTSEGRAVGGRKMGLMNKGRTKVHDQYVHTITGESKAKHIWSRFYPDEMPYIVKRQ